MSLIGWWPLTDESGDTTDYSGEGNHGTVNGATRGVAGRGGLQAMSFDGTDDDIQIDNTTFDATNFTVTAWIRPRILHDGVIVTGQPSSDSGDYRNRVTLWNDGGLNYDNFPDDGTGGILTDPVISSGTWHHVAVSLDSGYNCVIYVNGEVVATSTVEQYTGSTPVDTFGIGSRPLSNNVYFDGEIAGVRRYSRVLAQSEIQTLYEWGSGDYTEPADNDDGGVSYYSFNSSNALDQWGSNDGTVNGATYVSDGGPRGDGAYSFDGTDDYIDLPSNILPSTGNFTISHWFYLDANDSTEPKSINHRDGRDIVYHVVGSSGGDYEMYDGNSYQPIFTPIAGIWHHVVSVIDTSTSTQTHYVNGSYETQHTYSSGTKSNVNRISGDTNSSIDNTNLWNGDIDDVRFYNRALEPWEVHELYQYGTLGRDMRDLLVRV